MPQPQIGMNQNSNPLVDALLQALTKPPSTPATPPPMTPAGDIRPIVASMPNQSFPITSAGNGVPPMPSVPVPQPQQPSGGRSGLMDFLIRMAPSLVSTGVGMAVPGALAGAAGFNTGYAGGLDKADDRAQKGKLLDLKYKSLTEEKPLKPTYKQDQKIKSIKSGLKRGKVTIGRDFGEPTDYEIKSIDDAHKAISDAGLDPRLFEAELSQYEPIDVLDSKGRETAVRKMDLEQALKEGYKLR